MAQIIWPSFSGTWPGMVSISDFPFVRGAANVLIRPSGWKKHVYKEEGPSELSLGRPNISTAPREKHQQQNANTKHIGSANTRNIEAGTGRERNKSSGRMRRSKRSGESKKQNNKKLLENISLHQQ